MVSIAVCNPKGGVGKTSTVFHLAGHLALLGVKVLLVDADPQASLSTRLFGKQALAGLPREGTWAVLADDDPVAPASLVRPTLIEGVHAVVGNRRHLTPLKGLRPGDPGYEMSVFALTRVTEEAPGLGYDFCLLDCPGDLDHCSRNALAASHYVLVPLQPENFGAEGMAELHEHIEEVRRVNPGLRVLGYLIQMMKRRTLLHRGFERQIRQDFGDLVFATVIPHAIDFPAALFARRPVSHYRPGSEAARSMAGLAREILERVQADLGRREAAWGE